MKETLIISIIITFYSIFNMFSVEEIITKYYKSQGNVVAYDVNGTTNYVHTDHLGSVVAVTDTTGNIVKNTSYKPFGETITDTVTTNIKFTGYIKDSTGMYYANARYYNPMIGKFISADPARDGFNVYAYCTNNPIMFTDPSGMTFGMPKFRQLQSLDPMLKLDRELLHSAAEIMQTESLERNSLKVQMLDSEKKFINTRFSTSNIPNGTLDDMFSLQVQKRVNIEQIVEDQLRTDGASESLINLERNRTRSRVSFEDFSRDNWSKTYYPAYNGGIPGTHRIGNIPVGTELFRFGGDGGFFFGLKDSPLTRVLPPGKQTRISRFTVTREFEAEMAVAAPYYGTTGRAIQIKTTLTAKELMENGYLFRDVKDLVSTDSDIRYSADLESTFGIHRDPNKFEIAASAIMNLNRMQKK